MTTTPLERVARAICRAINGLAAERYIEARWKDYLPAATATLQALRQVDDETVEAMAAERGWRGPNRTRDTASLAGRAFKSLLGCILSQSPNQGSER